MAKLNEKIEKKEESYKPMSVEAPTLEEQIEALKLRIAILEHNCKCSHGQRQPFTPKTYE